MPAFSDPLSRLVYVTCIALFLPEVLALHAGQDALSQATYPAKVVRIVVPSTSKNGVRVVASTGARLAAFIKPEMMKWENGTWDAGIKSAKIHKY